MTEQNVCKDVTEGNLYTDTLNSDRKIVVDGTSKLNRVHGRIIYIQGHAVVKEVQATNFIAIAEDAVVDTVNCTSPEENGLWKSLWALVSASAKKGEVKIHCNANVANVRASSFVTVGDAAIVNTIKARQRVVVGGLSLVTNIETDDNVIIEGKACVDNVKCSSIRLGPSGGESMRARHLDGVCPTVNNIICFGNRVLLVGKAQVKGKIVFLNRNNGMVYCDRYVGKGITCAPDISECQIEGGRLEIRTYEYASYKPGDGG